MKNKKKTKTKTKSVPKSKQKAQAKPRTKEKVELLDDSIGKASDALNTQSIVNIVDDAPTTEEDEVSVFRDIMTMNDDERFSLDDNANLSSIRLTSAPKPHWADDPNNVKFKTGQKVIKKEKSGDSRVYIVSYSGKEKNTYVIIASGSQAEVIVTGDDIKLAPKNSEWVRYWDTVPVIKAPIIVTDQPKKKNKAPKNK